MPKRLYAFLLGITALGAGCIGASAPVRKEIGSGAALVMQATAENGAPVSLIDGNTGRLFSTSIGATFKDERDAYTTPVAGERIAVQLGVGGTVEKDRQLLEEQRGLTQLEDAVIGAWKITAAFDEEEKRWTVRAVSPDPFMPETMYHVIECLGAPESKKIFWNGCRTVIERATVSKIPATF